jgi:hypothetical protein
MQTRRSRTVSRADTPRSFFAAPSGPASSFFPSPPLVQKKLAMGAPGDSFEREADTMADQVVQAKCTECREEEKVQRQGAGAGPMTVPGSVQQTLEAGTGGGQTMQPALRDEMESAFGSDFSAVRVHTGPSADRLNRDLNARAFTYGTDVYFNSGEYRPDTDAGKHLLAHELTHVVQQSSGAAGVGVSRQTPSGMTPASLPKIPALTAQELMERLVGAVRAFEASPGGAPVNPPVGAGSALGAGYRTYAAVQLVDQEGNQIITAIGRYTGGGKAHAEATAVRSLEAFIARNNVNVNGARMMVVVDQVVCEGCTGALETFAEQSGISQMDTYLTNREGVTPKTAGRTFAKVGAGVKKAWTKTFTPKPGGTPPPSGPGATTGTPGANEPATLIEEPAPSGGAGTKTAAPAETKANVQTEIEVVSTVERPGGGTVTDLEIKLGGGLDGVNKAAGEGAGLPSKLGVRVTQSADGALLAAESTTGQPAAVAEAFAQQILKSGPSSGQGGTGASSLLADAAPGLEGAGEGAAEGAAIGTSRALSRLATGVKWGGTAVFVVVTGYQLITATPEQRPRVVAQAGGGLAGGALGTFVICNLLLDLETAGGGILICGLIAGGVGGYAGSELAGEAYDAATMTDLDRALQELARQPVNVRRLYWSLIADAGSQGLPVSSSFVHRFINVVPSNLSDAELITLAGQLRARNFALLARNTDDAIAAIRAAVYNLPRRGVDLFRPIDITSKTSLELPPGLSFGQGAGKVTILPGFGKTPLIVPSTVEPLPGVIPLLQIDLENPKKKK